MPASAATLSWDVPRPLWRSGLNDIVFNIKGAGQPSLIGASADTRLLGIAVTSIDLTELPPPSGIR